MTRPQYARRVPGQPPRGRNRRPEMGEESVIVVACPPDPVLGAPLYDVGATFQMLELTFGLRERVWPDGLALRLAPPRQMGARQRGAPVEMVVAGDALIGGGWRCEPKRWSVSLAWKRLGE